MKTTTFRWPIVLQICLVLGLFAAALGSLWHASSSVVGREQRRNSANQRLGLAREALEKEGIAAFRAIRPYPEYMGPEEWAAVGRLLRQAADRVRRRFGDVECGYYIPGRSGPAFRPVVAPGPTPPGPAARVYNNVETQADAAYRKKTLLSVVEAIPPETVAIQAAPAGLDGRTVGAVWTMIHLDDPIFLDEPTDSYRLFVGLALAGIVVSTALTTRLVATIRRQAAERDRLQWHLRRRERLAALGQLLAGVAHEVRNPLAGIRSTAQLWQRGLAFDAEALAGLVNEVDRLEEIIASLLQFSRADTQQKAPGSLNDVVVEASRLAEPAAQAAGVTVAIDLDPQLPPVEMSAPALLQIFRNLTGNAIQAMPGGGTLRLATRADAARREVSATVRDDGAGLSARAIEHLFEPFFTTKPEGTGLGLAIAREIALAHGGDLRADNRADAPGAEFTLVLPAIETPARGLPR